MLKQRILGKKIEINFLNTIIYVSKEEGDYLMRITIIGGAYGSGKTEFAINYAKYLKTANGGKVGLIDLDIVNPYFRSRDLTEQMGQEGITVVSSELAKENVDIPALSPRIYSLLQDRSYRVVIDVGGDPVGARALGRFNQYFTAEPYDFWIVINPFRPDTKSVDQVVKLIEGLQTAARIRATGLVANINLGRETTLEIWRQGLPLIGEVANRMGLPIVYQAVAAGLMAENADFFKDFQAFPMHLTMVPPWSVSE